MEFWVWLSRCLHALPNVQWCGNMYIIFVILILFPARVSTNRSMGGMCCSCPRIRRERQSDLTVIYVVNILLVVRRGSLKFYHGTISRLSSSAGDITYQMGAFCIFTAFTCANFYDCPKNDNSLTWTIYWNMFIGENGVFSEHMRSNCTGLRQFLS